MARVNIRGLLRNSDTARGLRSDFWRIRRLWWGRSSSAVYAQYIQSHAIRKLQIGAGPIAQPGWLGTDLWPTDTVAFLDATKCFPIDDQTFDYVHSEHMIEHINWFQGLAMLRECRRILKPGGMVRIATPDLAAFISLYTNPGDASTNKYIRWTTDLHLPGITAYRGAFVVNSQFYNWNHKFIYDAGLLEMALREAGFVDVKRYAAGESDNEHLRKIEMHGQIGQGDEEMNRFETLVLEATRPAQVRG
jgi:predicted SAM-dependent methyltransferase